MAPADALCSFTDFFGVSLWVRQAVADLIDVSYTDTLKRKFLKRAV